MNKKSCLCKVRMNLLKVITKFSDDTYNSNGASKSITSYKFSQNNLEF